MHCMMVSKISKHLMLLFNAFEQMDEDGRNIFQNISCYCLTSKISSLRTVAIPISKHLMLLFNMPEQACH